MARWNPNHNKFWKFYFSKNFSLTLKKVDIDAFLDNEAILPKVPTYEEAVRAQLHVNEESIIPQDQEEIEEDEEIIPITKTYQEQATPLYKEPPSSTGYTAMSAGNVTPEVQTSAVSGLGSYPLSPN